MAKEYEVQAVYIRNDRTRKTFTRGAIVSSKDFPVKTLKHWAAKEPPVIIEVKDGSDSKR